MAEVTEPIDLAIVVNVLRGRISDQEYERAILLTQQQSLLVRIDSDAATLRTRNELIAQLEAQVEELERRVTELEGV